MAKLGQFIVVRIFNLITKRTCPQKSDKILQHLRPSSLFGKLVRFGKCFLIYYGMVQLNKDTSKFTTKLVISLVEINIIESADLLSLCGKLDPFNFG